MTSEKYHAKSLLLEWYSIIDAKKNILKENISVNQNIQTRINTQQIGKAMDLIDHKIVLF